MGLIFVTLLLIAGGLLGITGLQRSNGALATLFGDRFEPSRRLSRINLLVADNRAEMALALHHAPRDGGVAANAHLLSTHLSNIDRNRSETDALWADYLGNLRDDDERKLAESYGKARQRYLEEGLLPARAALAAGDFATAERLLLGAIDKHYEEVTRSANRLQKYLDDRARSDLTRVTQRNEDITVLAIWGITGGSLLLMLAGVYFFRATVMPMERAIRALENIAEGNLSDAIDDVAFGEPGRVIAAVTVMRMHLKVMLDEIRQCSGSIHDQCRALNGKMMNLAEHSDEQHDRVHQTLDTLIESCAGLAALTEQAEALHGALATQGSSEVTTAPHVDDLASEARVQRFAVENLAGELRQVALLIVDNREDVQGAWSASQRLEQTAGELEKLVKYFE
jgi:methyl-accepting chemotaxis protein